MMHHNFQNTTCKVHECAVEKTIKIFVVSARESRESLMVGDGAEVAQLSRFCEHNNRCSVDIYIKYRI